MEKEKILFADNQPDDLTQWGAVLEQAGYQVTTAADFAAANLVSFSIVAAREAPCWAAAEKGSRAKAF